MKDLLLLVLVFLLVVSVKAQSIERDSLLIDSLLVQSLNDDFKEESLHLHTINTKLLHYNHKRQFRSIKIYAHVFDELFKRGFDLEWDISTVTFKNNSISLKGPSDSIVNPQRISLLKQNEVNRFRSKLIHSFIRIKEKYECNVIRIKDTWEETTIRFDETENHENVSEFVDNLMMYGNYAKPKTLRKILLGEYAWYNEELRNKGRM